MVGIFLSFAALFQTKTLRGFVASHIKKNNLVATFKRKRAICTLISRLACNVKDSGSLEKMHVILRSARFT